MTRSREHRYRHSAFLSFWLVLLLFGLPASTRAAEPAPTLQQELLKEGAAALVRAARDQGDPTRGALVFYRPDLACTRCHTAGENGAALGPDLARADKEATDVYLVESVLLPSK